MRRNSHRWTTGFAATLLGIAGAAWLPGMAHGAFDGDADIRLGDALTAEFTGAAGESHLFHFFATAGSRIGVEAKPQPGSDLRLSLRLVRPGGHVVPLGKSVVPTGRGAAIRGFRLPFSGWFSVEVTAKSGTGIYDLRSSGTPAGSLKGLVPAAEAGRHEFEFSGSSGTVVSVTASPRRGSRARPAITSLVAPDGTVIPVVADDSGSGSAVRDFTLDATGTWHVAWENNGSKGDVRLRFTFEVPKGPVLGYTFGEQTGLPRGVVDSLNTGVPGGSPLPGFAGSDACGRCHDEEFRGWADTVHNLAVRDWRRTGLTGKAFVNDINGNGIDDFRDGLDLATQPAFATYGAIAPRLSYEPAAPYPYKISFGGVRYDVVRTMGGNGQWKQRYLLLVGNHMFPSPVQFNDGDLAAKAYVTYDAANWYAGSAGNWTLKYETPAAMPKELSFEARCSGCHNTGETITREADGDYVVGYTDFNIGCEQCHGPALEHTKDPLAVKPVNPRAFLDGTAEGVEKANDVCAKCHTRGAAKDFFPNPVAADAKAGFPYSQAGGVPHVGEDGIDLDSAFDVTTSPADFWGRKADPFDPSQAVWVTSRSHRQQALDMQRGAHSSDVPFAPTCFDCHDPHVRRQKHQIVSQRTETGVPGKSRDDVVAPITMPTRTDDNSLCLSCHQGHGPFVRVTKQDVAAIGTTGAPQVVVDAVVDHMKDISMPVAASAYDPTGTKVGQCVSCHMPLLEKTAVSRTDKAGLRLHDEHSHTFQTVNPRVSQLYKDGTVGMSNSCTVCHGTGDPVFTIISQWWADDADADGTFHSDTPRSFQNGIANPNRNGGVYCVQCHTTGGFVQVQVKGGRMDQATADGLIRDAVARDKGIACDACHGAGPDGTFATGANPLRFPKPALCQKCHNAQTVVFADFQQFGEMVRHPQKEMYESTAGATVPAQFYSTSNPHRGGAFADACATCHYNEGKDGATHQFEAQISVCKDCHGEITNSFDRPGKPGQDWDGDGLVEGSQTEVSGLLAKLQTALTSQPGVTFSGGYFEMNGATDHKLTGASDAVKRAAYNWYSVSYDASRGVHGPTRAIQLLQKSYKELTGTDASTNLK